MTFFSVFDVPVFWPILLVYWIVLFVLTMKRQIAHMVKYRYMPFSLGKQKYGRSCLLVPVDPVLTETIFPQVCADLDWAIFFRPLALCFTFCWSALGLFKDLLNCSNILPLLRTNTLPLLLSITHLQWSCFSLFSFFNGFLNCSLFSLTHKYTPSVNVSPTSINYSY